MTPQERRRKAAKMLSDYKSLKLAIKSYQIDLQTLAQVTAGSQMAMTYDQPSGGKTNKVTSTVEQEVVKLEQQRQWLNEQIAFLQNQVDKVDLALDSLDYTYKTLLTLKYLEGKRWIEVYRALNYSEEYIRTTLNRRALDQVARCLFPEVQLQALTMP